MKKLLILNLICSLTFLNGFASEKTSSKPAEDQSEEGHKHSAGEAEAHNDSKDQDHEENGEEEDGHDHAEKGHGHGGGEEASSGVGPEKGITAKGEEGLKFSPEAEKTIGFTTETIGNGNIRLPLKSIVTTKSDKSVFRLRDGWYKRVRIQIISKDKTTAVIKSDGLKPGDKIVVTKTGFLRIAEVFSEEGAEHTH